MDQKPTDKHTGKVSWYGQYVAKQTAYRMRDEAMLWLLMDDKDFPAVCDMAGVTPTVVRKGVQKMMEASHEQKTAWYTNGIQVSDMWRLGDARPECVGPQGDG